MWGNTRISLHKCTLHTLCCCPLNPILSDVFGSFCGLRQNDSFQEVYYFPDARLHAAYATPAAVDPMAVKTAAVPAASFLALSVMKSSISEG